MVNVVIHNKKYKLPVLISELSLNQGMQLLASFKLEDTKSLDYMKATLAILLNCEVELLLDIPNWQIEILYKSIPLLNDKQTVYYVESFKINHKLFGMIDLENISVLEFMELEDLFEDEIENIDKILTILYRRIVNKKQNVKNILINIATRLYFKSKLKFNFKPLKYKFYETKALDLQHKYDNTDFFRDNINYAIARGALQHYAEFNEKLKKEFWPVFEGAKNPDDEEEYDPFEKLEEAEKHKRRDIPSLGEIWGLYHLVYEISNGDKRTIDYWYTKPIKELFTQCIYVKQRNTYLEKLNNG